MLAILNILPYLFWLALALGILVFVHELGHFLFARMFGMRVDAFAIGFPPFAWRKKIGQTEYRLGMVPLGGYVKIAGMIDESMDTDFVDSEPEPDEFRSKPVWQRMLVISGGVIFNIILAFTIFIGLALWYGEAYIPADNIEGIYVADSSIAYEMGLRTGDRIVRVNGSEVERYSDVLGPRALASSRLTFTVNRGGNEIDLLGPDRLVSRLSATENSDIEEAFGISIYPSQIGNTQPGYPAAEAGIRRGDRIVGIDGEPIQFWEELTQAIVSSNGEELLVRWSRPDSLVREDDPEPVASQAGYSIFEAPITPKESDDGSTFLLGVNNDPQAISVERESYSLGEGIVAGINEAWGTTSLYASFVARLFTGRESVRDSVGGPIMIAKQTKDAADLGAYGFWRIVAVLSIALAVFNVLPIPVLDGGHLVFLIYEGITRREPSVKFRMIVQQVGFVILLVF
ncbi:MAG: RIP metalloprotease RseP, partial [Rubricoccaceae bacterium]|nr:RIP metalloprotease RseP [Rubricoccaceae bacterium]